MENEQTAYELKNTTSSVKRGVGSVVAQACMAASGTWAFMFIDDSRSGMMKCQNTIQMSLHNAN